MTFEVRFNVSLPAIMSSCIGSYRSNSPKHWLASLQLTASKGLRQFRPLIFQYMSSCYTLRSGPRILCHGSSGESGQRYFSDKSHRFPPCDTLSLIVLTLENMVSLKREQQQLHLFSTCIHSIDLSSLDIYPRFLFLQLYVNRDLKITRTEWRGVKGLLHHCQSSTTCSP